MLIVFFPYRIFKEVLTDKVTFELRSERNAEQATRLLKLENIPSKRKSMFGLKEKQDLAVRPFFIEQEEVS